MDILNNKLSLVFAFLGGITFSFSGCIYPLIPVLVGSILSYTNRSKLKGFILSSIYVLGMAFTYSGLGLVSALTGRLFGSLTNHPLVRIVVGLIISFFGFAFLKDFVLNFFSFRFSFGSSKNNYLRIFIMGLISSLLISPCVSPVLGTILLYTALKKDIFYGWLLLLSFAFGLGFILILSGTFSSFLFYLPKPDSWMENLRRFGASILILMGIYFIIGGLRGLF
ncbi:MAG: sulfite exporter TauE/SafE family protein [Candidatus Omnitrophica bacterium]|nr:sulfite exporter TauE/SafE family protein [Candidatus Omnitrophota bacterium]